MSKRFFVIGDVGCFSPDELVTTLSKRDEQDVVCLVRDQEKATHLLLIAHGDGDVQYHSCKAAQERSPPDLPVVVVMSDFCSLPAEVIMEISLEMAMCPERLNPEVKHAV